MERGRPKPASAKRQGRSARANRGSSPWPAFAGSFLAPVIAVAIALLLTGRAYWEKWSEDAAKTKETKSADAAKATEIQSAEEHMSLVGQKVELQDKLDTISQQATSLADQKSKAEREKSELEGLVAQAKARKSSEQLGPNVMTAQKELLGRLVKMAEEVDRLRGAGQEEERLAVSKRVEVELAELEASAAKEEVGSAERQQKTALIALVRSALQSDRDGEPMADEDWSEEGLYKKHGLITYASEKYWEEAYAGDSYGSSFDWFGTWEEQDLHGQSLAGLVRPLLSPGLRTLVLGCGNSNLSAELHQHGQRSVVSVDFSDAVIQQMRSRYVGVEGMEWKTMDVTKMDFDDGSIDFAIEKGLFDALFAGSGERVHDALLELARVLRPGARFVSVSFSADRLERLFDATQTALLDCQKSGKLSYGRSKAVDDSTSDSKPDSHKEDAGTVYVYSCERKVVSEL